MKPNITLAKAKKLSILKWELIVANKGVFSPIDKRNPALRNIKHNCGFCERWRTEEDGFEESGCDCSQCEFAKAVGADCNKDESLFDRWCSDEPFGGEPTKLAKEILEIIKEIPTK